MHVKCLGSCLRHGNSKQWQQYGNVLREAERGLSRGLQIVLYSWVLGCETAGDEGRWQKYMLDRWAGFQTMEAQECKAIKNGQNQDISMVICQIYHDVFWGNLGPYQKIDSEYGFLSIITCTKLAMSVNRTEIGFSVPLAKQ